MQVQWHKHTIVSQFRHNMEDKAKNAFVWLRFLWSPWPTYNAHSRVQCKRYLLLINWENMQEPVNVLCGVHVHLYPIEIPMCSVLQTPNLLTSFSEVTEQRTSLVLLWKRKKKRIDKSQLCFLFFGQSVPYYSRRGTVLCD